MPTPVVAQPKKMIKIKLPLTMHRPGPDFVPGKMHEVTGQVTGGVYDIEMIAPNTPIEIEELEGRKLIEQFAHLGAEVIEPADVPAKEPEKARSFATGPKVE